MGAWQASAGPAACRMVQGWRPGRAPHACYLSPCQDIALDLVTARNVDEVVGVLKKEAAKTQVGCAERG